MEPPVDALTARVLLQTLDEISLGIVLAARDLRVLAMNAAAAAIASDGGAIRIEDGRLRLSFAGIDAEFAHSVAALEREQLFTIPRAGAPPLHVSMRANAANRGVVTAFLIDAAQHLQPQEKLIQRLYDLTPAESRVAMAAALGGTAAEIACELSLSVHTVRSHLKSIFAKSGAATRGELVRLLTGATGALRPAE